MSGNFKLQSRIFLFFSLIFWAMQRLHMFTLKFPELYQGDKIKFKSNGCFCEQNSWRILGVDILGFCLRIEGGPWWGVGRPFGWRWGYTQIWCTHFWWTLSCSSSKRHCLIWSWWKSQVSTTSYRGNWGWETFFLPKTWIEAFLPFFASTIFFFYSLSQFFKRIFHWFM